MIWKIHGLNFPVTLLINTIIYDQILMKIVNDKPKSVKYVNFPDYTCLVMSEFAPRRSPNVGCLVASIRVQRDRLSTHGSCSRQANICLDGSGLTDWLGLPLEISPRTSNGAEKTHHRLPSRRSQQQSIYTQRGKADIRLVLDQIAVAFGIQVCLLNRCGFRRKNIGCYTKNPLPTGGVDNLQRRRYST